MNPTPLSKDTDRTERSECPHAGVHPTCLTIQRSYPPTWKYTDPPEVKWTPTPSPQGVDGAVACRPRSTGWHVRVTKDSTNQPARECDVTMSFHGSKTKTSTDTHSKSSVNELGTLTGPRSLFWTRHRGPHPPTHPAECECREGKWFVLLLRLGHTWHEKSPSRLEIPMVGLVGMTAK